jgi:outer membrane protein assembly factor BamB
MFRSKKTLLSSVAVLIAIIIGGITVYLRSDHSNSHPAAKLIPTPPTTPAAPTPAAFSWPLYGYNAAHTRFFASRLKPPFKKVWTHYEGGLLEFPPVILGDRIFQLDDNGMLNAINKTTGASIWSHKVGTLSASTPAVVGDSVYVTVLAGGHNGQPGRIVALNSSTGAIRWARDLPSPSESSPLVDHGQVFFGSQGGTVYSLRVSDGKVTWTYHAGGSVKASPTLSGGLLYFGDYSGQAQAISEKTGKQVWSASAGGTFYSTAAVKYGRVFLGNTNGGIYAYDAFTGKLDWTVPTGAYVYSSPAVADAPGVGPTIYLGSYDGTFRALNARSGQLVWSYNAGGKISGSATIIGRTVYFADLGQGRTYGIDISTGKVVFKTNSGSFDPVIADTQNVYLTGYGELYALTPKSR